MQMISAMTKYASKCPIKSNGFCFYFYRLNAKPWILFNLISLKKIIQIIFNNIRISFEPDGMTEYDFAVAVQY